MTLGDIPVALVFAWLLWILGGLCVFRALICLLVGLPGLALWYAWWALLAGFVGVWVAP